MHNLCIQPHPSTELKSINRNPHQATKGIHPTKYTNISHWGYEAIRKYQLLNQFAKFSLSFVFSRLHVPPFLPIFSVILIR